MTASAVSPIMSDHDNTYVERIIIMDDVIDVKVFPELNLTNSIHVCGAGNGCIGGFVSGITDTYDEDGKIVAHLMIPQPGMPCVCSPEFIPYHKPKNERDKRKGTWHLECDCIGGVKRMSDTRLKLV